MAKPQCMSQDGKQAVFVATMLDTGDGFQLCDECLAMWAAALLSTMTGVDASPFIQALSEPEMNPEDPNGDSAEDQSASGTDPSADHDDPKPDGRTFNGSADHGTDDAPNGAKPPGKARRKPAAA